MISSIFNYGRNIFKSIGNRVYSHYRGLRSLYLFFKIAYHVKYIINENKINDEEEINKLKNRVLECGCIGIKFTQWIISKLKGIDKDDYKFLISKFDDVFDDCCYHDFEYTKSVFEAEFNRKFEDIFDITKLEVLASGSIGQVYKTRFKKVKISNKNNDIVIKVRHPYIEHIKSYQMILIYILIGLQKFNWFKRKYHLHFNLNDFINNINKQIDFNIEAYNCSRIEKAYKDNEYVVIPKIHNFSKKEHLCSPRINKICL